MWTWVFSLMVLLLPPRQNDIGRLRTYVVLAHVIAEEAHTPEDASVLVAVGYLESGFTPSAVGALKEQGVWQLMQPAPVKWRDQAREALRRWHVQGPCGYAGEPKSHCVLGRHRALLAAMLLAAYPAPQDHASDQLEAVARAAQDAHRERHPYE